MIWRPNTAYDHRWACAQPIHLQLLAASRRIDQHFSGADTLICASLKCSSVYFLLLFSFQTRYHFFLHAVWFGMFTPTFINRLPFFSFRARGTWRDIMWRPICNSIFFHIYFDANLDYTFLHYLARVFTIHFFSILSCLICAHGLFCLKTSIHPKPSRCFFLFDPPFTRNPCTWTQAKSKFFSWHPCLKKPLSRNPWPEHRNSWCPRIKPRVLRGFFWVGGYASKSEAAIITYFFLPAR